MANKRELDGELDRKTKRKFVGRQNLVSYCFLELISYILLTLLLA